MFWRTTVSGSSPYILSYLCPVGTHFAAEPRMTGGNQPCQELGKPIWAEGMACVKPLGWEWAGAMERMVLLELSKRGRAPG